MTASVNIRAGRVGRGELHSTWAERPARPSAKETAPREAEAPWDPGQLGPAESRPPRAAALAPPSRGSQSKRDPFPGRRPGPGSRTRRARGPGHAAPRDGAPPGSAATARPGPRLDDPRGLQQRRPRRAPPASPIWLKDNLNCKSNYKRAPSNGALNCMV